MDRFFLQLYKSFPNHDLLLLGFFLAMFLLPLPLLQLLSLYVLLQSLAGLPLELVELLDIAAQLLELVDMMHESHFLRK